MIPKHFNAMIHVERISLWSIYFMDTTHKIYFRTSYILGYLKIYIYELIKP